MAAVRVLHLVGSATDAFTADLSRLYARDAVAALAEHRYDHRVAWVGPDRRWRFPASLDREAVDAAAPLTVGEAVAHLAELAPDVAVPQMFDLPGMTSYRALLDVLGIPFVGNRADVMAAGAHKGRARALVAAAGVAVPPGETLRAGERPSGELPVVVKPAESDNSVGVTLVRDPATLDAALAAAFAHGPEVLVERFVPLGREVRCGILERDGELVGLPLEEYRLDADAKPIRGLADKIVRDDGGDLRLVAKDDPDVGVLDPSDPATAPVWAAAKAAHRALGCRDYSLFDFRLDPDGRPWFLEAGLYCSFAPASVVAVMARASGIGLGDLFATAVAGALART